MTIPMGQGLRDRSAHKSALIGLGGNYFHSGYGLARVIDNDVELTFDVAQENISSVRCLTFLNDVRDFFLRSSDFPLRFSSNLGAMGSTIRALSGISLGCRSGFTRFGCFYREVS